MCKTYNVTLSRESQELLNDGNFTEFFNSPGFEPLREKVDTSNLIKLLKAQDIDYLARYKKKVREFLEREDVDLDQFGNEVWSLIEEENFSALEDNDSLRMLLIDRGVNIVEFVQRLKKILSN